jgi:heme/copper-type cytochrome/quinol oxidase subunit 2
MIVFISIAAIFIFVTIILTFKYFKLRKQEENNNSLPLISER